MGQNKDTEISSNKYPSNNQSTELNVGKSEEKYEQSRAKQPKVRLMFRENRTFHLKIGRVVHTFGPYETKIFDADIIYHPHFITKQKYFSIQKEI